MKKKVTVEVGPRTIALVRSPLYYVTSALFGVACSFALLFIYQSGTDGKSFFSPWVQFNVATVWLVQFYYFVIASSVINQVRARKDKLSDSEEPSP